MGIAAVLDGRLEELEKEVLEGMELVSGDDVGLDYRAGRMYIDENGIAVRGGGSLDYYGGFEYVDSDDIIRVGSLKIYSRDSDRVAECIEVWESKKQG